MRIVVIGGTGHVGTFLVPRLVEAGHRVMNISRGERKPYHGHAAWQEVEQIFADRQAEEASGTFASRVSRMNTDVVVDMTCFTIESATHLLQSMRSHAQHLIFCGSIWVHGPSMRIPVTEDDHTPPIGQYGIQKAAITKLLREANDTGDLATTTLHPGHISGPGWLPINPQGNLDTSVWEALSAGQELLLPGSGAELMHHVHADDVAQAFHLAIEHRDQASGQEFHVCAPSAMTVRGFAQTVARWFDRQSQLRFVTWEEFNSSTTGEFAKQSWEHLHRSLFASIDKAQQLLGYTPRYEPDEAVRDAISWLIDHGDLSVAGGLREENT